MAAIRERTKAEPEPEAKRPNPRAGTKQALLIEMLQRTGGATMDEIVAGTGWEAHAARGAISGALGKKLGLSLTSTKVAERGRVYRLDPAA